MNLLNSVNTLRKDIIRILKYRLFNKVNFASIPEIVFVESIPEVEELGLFVLQATSRVNPGDTWWLTGNRLQKHPRLGGGDWKAPSGLALTSHYEGLPEEAPYGELPEGVTFNPNTGVLSYDGTPQETAVVDRIVQLTHGDGVSNPFVIRILRPTVVFGSNADNNIWKNHSDVTAIDSTLGGLWENPDDPHDSDTVRFHIKGSATTDAPNVVYVMPGRYSGHPEDQDYVGRLAIRNQGEAIYVLGNPSNRPAFHRYNSHSFNAKDGLKVGCFKNLVLEDRMKQTIKEYNYEYPGKYQWAKIDCGQWLSTGMDGFSMAAREGINGLPVPTVLNEVWLTNVRTMRTGGSTSCHTFYMHGRPNVIVNFNNLWLRGRENSSGLKATTYRVRLRNSRIDSDPTLDGVERDDRLEKLVDIIAAGQHIIYNNILTGVRKSASERGPSEWIFWRQRRTSVGSEFPAPPTGPKDNLFDINMDEDPPTTAISGGGFNPPDGILGDFGNGTDTFMDEEFWDWVRSKPVDDPSNEATFKKFVSFNEFNLLYRDQSDGGWTAIRDDGTAPGLAPIQFNNATLMSPVPYNWVERSVTFLANNIFTGWVEEDLNPGDNVSGRRKMFRFDWTPDAFLTNWEDAVGISGWVAAEDSGEYSYLGLDLPWQERHAVFLGGDVGPHEEASVSVDENGQPISEAKHVPLPDWFEV